VNSFQCPYFKRSGHIQTLIVLDTYTVDFTFTDDMDNDIIRNEHFTVDARFLRMTPLSEIQSASTHNVFSLSTFKFEAKQGYQCMRTAVTLAWTELTSLPARYRPECPLCKGFWSTNTYSHIFSNNMDDNNLNNTHWPKSRTAKKTKSTHWWWVLISILICTTWLIKYRKQCILHSKCLLRPVVFRVSSCDN